MRGNNNREVQLLVLKNCPSCEEAERVWRQVAEQAPMDLAVLDIGQPAGETVAEGLALKTFPAVIIDGRLRAIGVQSLAQALELLKEVTTADTD